MKQRFRRRTVVPIIAALLVVAIGSRGTADLIKLDNSGELRGTIDRKLAKRGVSTLTIRTLTGAVVVVDRKTVRFVTHRSLKVEQYETRARATEGTVAAQWDLAEWCRKNRLSKQRAACLRRIIALDPNHKKARYALGYIRHDDKWTTRDEIMRSQGYVKYKGRYVTPQELELLQKTQAELDSERKWFRKVRLWRGWLTGRNAKRRQAGLAELQKLDDPDAVAALALNFSKHKDARLRGLYVSILSRLTGDKPVAALVRQSLLDDDKQIRAASLDAISPGKNDVAMPLYAQALRNKNNAVVRRAGRGLERVGDRHVVPNLIAALVTTHRYRIRVPDKSGTISFGADGSFGSSGLTLPPQVEAMLRTGQLPYGVIIRPSFDGPPRKTRVVTVNYTHKNAEVLAALRRITGQSFGYDQRTWRLWLASDKNGTG